MPRLRTAPPLLASIGTRIAPAPGDERAIERKRNTVSPWRAWYKTARWAGLRLRTLIRDNFTCRICGQVRRSPQLVADHVVPHRGDAALFWDEANLQTLCATCHSSAKQKEEQAKAM